MTYEKLREIIEANNIPQNVELLSDSGWECNETPMDGVYYNAKLNHIVFTQSCSKYERYDSRCGRYNKISGYVALTKDENE